MAWSIRKTLKLGLGKIKFLKSRTKKILTAELSEQDNSKSPFEFFGIPENCSRSELDQAFRNKISNYEPRVLESLSPESKMYGQEKSIEIYKAYQECTKILRKSTHA